MEVHRSEFKEDETFFTDASGSWGCGAVWGNKWIQCPWNSSWTAESIVVKELLPIVTPRRACAKQGLCDRLCPFIYLFIYQRVR